MWGLRGHDLGEYPLPQATVALGGIAEDGMVAAAYTSEVDGRAVRGAVAWLPDGTRKDLPPPGPTRP
ncbi:hypothetical protein AB0M46_08460 [Dactylosporangium sp. NPDC051485]|uniref:hypothetical protein n=1 Tax=Dactylosporangium sp. NPDC051485 TaxID=3154846 RepID=UPI00341C098F